MNATTPDQCLTCQGTGETATEWGLSACPDRFADGKPPTRGAKREWRLRQIERTHRGTGTDAEPDILWLIHELRRSREALTGILTRSQDTEESDAFAAEIRHRAIEALALYDHADPGHRS